jgi:hypothetical protein
VRRSRCQRERPVWEDCSRGWGAGSAVGAADYRASNGSPRCGFIVSSGRKAIKWDSDRGDVPSPPLTSSRFNNIARTCGFLANAKNYLVKGWSYSLSRSTRQVLYPPLQAVWAWIVPTLLGTSEHQRSSPIRGISMLKPNIFRVPPSPLVHFGFAQSFLSAFSANSLCMSSVMAFVLFLR